MATLDAGDCLVVLHFYRGVSEPCDQFVIVATEQCWMRFACWTKVGFDTEMDLHRAAREPASASLFQFDGFLDFGHAQQSDVERASFTFHAWRHGELDVVDGGKRRCAHFRQIGRRLDEADVESVRSRG